MTEGDESQYEKIAKPKFQSIEKGKNCQTWPSWQEVNGGEKVEIKESGKVD